MKKVFLAVLMVFVLIITAGCSVKPPVKVNLLVINIGAQNYQKEAADKVIIKNSEDLFLFIVENYDKFDLTVDTSNISYGTISFINAVRKYGLDFFKDHHLALCITSGSSSAKYKFKKAEIIDDNIEIYVEDGLKNNSSTDIVWRIIIAEISTEKNFNDINFNFV